MAVDNVQNKVAFGAVFPPHGQFGEKIHGKIMPPGCLRVSVEGYIKEDALIPIPVPGEIETVLQAVGSHVAWPEELIVYPTVSVV